MSFRGRRKTSSRTITPYFKVYFTQIRALKNELHAVRFPLSISVCPPLDSPPLPQLGMVRSAAAALTRPDSSLYLPGGSRTRCARRERDPTGAARLCAASDVLTCEMNEDSFPRTRRESTGRLRRGRAVRECVPRRKPSAGPDVCNLPPVPINLKARGFRM